jgi:hypothetical protein
MAKSSNAVIATNGHGHDHTVIEKLKSDVRRYKERCQSLLAEMEALKNPDQFAAGERRKSSDAGGSDTSARLQRFHRLAQTVKTADGDKSSKVTVNGKKLIIESSQQQISGNSFDFGKLKQKKK